VDSVWSISLQDDTLFSGSSDGSAKMWTIVRAVELKSFKAFDDGVSSIQTAADRLLIAISNQLIQYYPASQLIVKVTDLQHVILGTSEYGTSVLVATKTINSLIVKQYNNENATLTGFEFSLDLGYSCSAFFADEKNLRFWYGLRDGSISKFSWTSKNYDIMVLL
jgi:hypothetical protein